MFDEAIQSFERALPLVKVGKSAMSLQMEASILQNIGAAYNEKGLFSEGVIYHREAATLHGKCLLLYVHSHISVFLNLVSVMIIKNLNMACWYLITQPIWKPMLSLLFSLLDRNYEKPSAVSFQTLIYSHGTNLSLCFEY